MTWECLPPGEKPGFLLIPWQRGVGGVRVCAYRGVPPGGGRTHVSSLQGTLIQHMKEHVLHGNMASSDIILYYTTVSGLLWAAGHASGPAASWDGPGSLRAAGLNLAWVWCSLPFCLSLCMCEQ